MSLGFWAGVALATGILSVGFALMVLTFAGHKKGWW